MNTVACYKITPDNQDVAVAPDGSIDLAHAAMVLGEYDLMAIEEAAKVAEATEGRAVLLTAGGEALGDTKLVKAALSRGASELYSVATPHWPTPTRSRPPPCWPRRWARWNTTWSFAAKDRPTATSSRWDRFWAACWACR